MVGSGDGGTDADSIGRDEGREKTVKGIPAGCGARYDEECPDVTATPMTATARKKKARSIRLIREASPEGPAVCCISDGKESAYYAIREIPCEIGGRGFAVHRLGLGTLYHVRVGEADDCSCECKGWLRHGHCKHVQGLLALTAAGKV